MLSVTPLTTWLSQPLEKDDGLEDMKQIQIQIYEDASVTITLDYKFFVSVRPRYPCGQGIRSELACHEPSTSKHPPSRKAMLVKSVLPLVRCGS
ncbi:hypothetical protein TNCV_2558551 [Trichonephila clavipes]|nr:hypothetical protein TNCV_2558551 [Trichonephila clavipes]